MGLLIKVPLLVGCLMLLINTKNALLCAAVWGVAVVVLGLLFSTAYHLFSASVHLSVLLWGAVSFLVALGYFSLLNYLEGKGWWWVAMPVGMAVLLLV